MTLLSLPKPYCSLNTSYSQSSRWFRIPAHKTKDKNLLLCNEITLCHPIRIIPVYNINVYPKLPHHTTFLGIVCLYFPPRIIRERSFFLSSTAWSNKSSSEYGNAKSLGSESQLLRTYNSPRSPNHPNHPYVPNLRHSRGQSSPVASLRSSSPNMYHLREQSSEIAWIRSSSPNLHRSRLQSSQIAWRGRRFPCP